MDSPPIQPNHYTKRSIIPYNSQILPISTLPMGVGGRRLIKPTKPTKTTPRIKVFKAYDEAVIPSKHDTLTQNMN